MSSLLSTLSSSSLSDSAATAAAAAAAEAAEALTMPLYLPSFLHLSPGEKHALTLSTLAGMSTTLGALIAVREKK